jgi:hypothetical protein
MLRAGTSRHSQKQKVPAFILWLLGLKKTRRL